MSRGEKRLSTMPVNMSMYIPGAIGNMYFIEQNNQKIIRILMGVLLGISTERLFWTFVRFVGCV